MVQSSCTSTTGALPASPVATHPSTWGYLTPPNRKHLCVFIKLTSNHNYSVGNLRLRLPQPPPPYSGEHNASSFGPSCPQQNLTRNFAFPGFVPISALELLAEVSTLRSNISEDCKYEVSTVVTKRKPEFRSICQCHHPGGREGRRQLTRCHLDTWRRFFSVCIHCVFQT